MSEKDLCNAIVQYLNYNGCHVWRVNTGMLKASYKGHDRMIKMSPTGTADIIGWRKTDGKFIGIEVKLPSTRKRVSSAQELFLIDAQMGHCIAGVATSPEEALQLVIK